MGICLHNGRAAYHLRKRNRSFPSLQSETGMQASAMHCGSWRFPYLSQRDHKNTLSAFSQARMNRFHFFLHIYNTYNSLLHITFVFQPVNYLFNVVGLECLCSCLWMTVILQYLGVIRSVGTLLYLVVLLLFLTFLISSKSYKNWPACRTR